MTKRYLMSFEDQTSALDYINGDITLVAPMVSLVGDDEVVYSKDIPNDKNVRFAKDEATGKLYFIVDGVSYVAVDLGLPSGTMWADKNVGAETPQDGGLYFDWGNVEGHTVDENGATTDGYSFNRIAYPTTFGGTYTGSTLDAEHDAATVNMGSDWRMPTSAETLELVENTDQYYIDLNGNILENINYSNLRSICFVKKGEAFDYNDRSNFIEIPLAGYVHDGTGLSGKDTSVNVWSSSVYESHEDGAYFFSFNNYGNINGADNSYRYYGRSVRGVRA